MERPTKNLLKSGPKSPRGLLAATAAGLLVWGCFAGLSPSNARAEAAPAVDPAARAAAAAKINAEGTALYKERDYRHALEKFLQAEAIDEDSNLLYNIARCYEMLGDRDAAIEKYEAFLAKPDADAQGKRRANDAIREMREAKAAQAAAGPARPVATTSATAAPAARPAGVALNGEAGATTAKPSFWTPPRITLGAGIVATAAGAVVYLLGVRDHDKVTSSPGYGMPAQVDPLSQVEAQRLVDSGNTKKLIGGITFGVGAALVVTSAVLYAIGDGHGAPNKEAAGVTVGMAPSRSGGQLLLEGRF
jgi:hypothetical protein